MKTICVFGDSITWGAWDYELGGWVNRLRIFLDIQKNMENKNDDDFVFLYNLGIAGGTTRDLLKRFDVETEAREPNIVIFDVGTNDAIFVKSQNKNLVPAKEFEDILQELIIKPKKFCDKIILIGLKEIDESKTTPIPWEEDYYYTNKSLAEYNMIIKKVANKNKVYYLEPPYLSKISDFEDGLHPNSVGHKKIFEKVKDFLEKEKII